MAQITFRHLSVKRSLFGFFVIYTIADYGCNGRNNYIHNEMDATSKCNVFVSRDYSERVHCEAAGIAIAATISHNTTSLTLKDNRVASLVEPHFFHLKKLKYLNLQDNEIQMVKSAVFKGMANLEELVLKNNKISVIGEKVFQHCKSLKTIDFSHNSIQHLTSFTRAMKSLPFLENVSFYNNRRLTTIHLNDMRHLANSSLTQLNLGNCRIRAIHANALAQLKNLRRLILSDNWIKPKSLCTAFTNISNTIDRIDLVNMQLTRVPNSLMEQLSSTNIRIINFQGNPITSIYEEDIPLVPSLQRISFKKCGVKEIKPNALGNLTALELLDLSRNHLNEIPLAVYYIPTLTKLDLSRNVPNTGTSNKFFLFDKMFVNMMSLRVLNLNNLDIDVLNRYALYGLSNLKNLSMKSSLQEIEEFAFESLKNLQFLDLSHNEVKNVTKNVFSGLNNLTHLFLNRNRLCLNSESEYFTSLVNLEVLDLSHNELTTIPRTDFINLHNLKHLILHHNQITQWSHHVICFQNSALQFLDLHKNDMMYITPQMLDDFDLLTALDVSDNPFICSKCDMYNFAEWTTTTTTKIKNKTLTKCFQPKNLAGKLVFNIKNPPYCIKWELPVGWVVAGIVSLATVLVGIGTCFHFRWYIRYYWFLTRAKVHRMREMAQIDNFRYDAFVSYNAYDREWLLQNLIPKLEHDDPRLSLCLHERDFEIGREIWSNIVESIDNSRKILVILSNNFLSSQWCTWEMNMAQFKLIDDNREALILILLEKIDKKKMTSTLRYILRTRTYLEWTENLQGQKLFWERLKFALQKPQFANQQQMVL